MAISVEGHIASRAVLNFTLVSTCIMRFWILRNRPRISLAGKISDALYYSMVCIGTGTVIAMFYKLAEERKIRALGLSPEEVYMMLLERRFLIALFVETFGYVFDIYLLKAAFVALYYDLFPHLARNLRYALHLTTFLVIAFFIVNLTMVLAWCRPITTVWDAGIESCSVLTNLTSVNLITFCNITTDIGLIVLPAIILRSLNLRRRDIGALAFVYIVGFMSIAATLIRYGILYNLIKTPTANPDTLDLVELWSAIEVILAALAFCLPAFRALLRTKTAARGTVHSRGYSDHSRSREVQSSRRVHRNGKNMFALTTIGREIEEDEERVLGREGKEMEVRIDKTFEISSKEISSEDGSVEGRERRASHGLPYDGKREYENSV